MEVKLYPDEDAIHLKITDGQFVKGQELDKARYLEFGQDGALIGIEFLRASEGVDLNDIPFHDVAAIGQLLQENEVKILTT